MPFLTLLRHGESQWNLENRFTGWVDVDLSPKGEVEAAAAGALLKDVPVDMLFTSVLKRAMRTAEIALDRAGRHDVPTMRDAALNERHYGDLQGLNKAETAQKYGAEQVHIWRRSYDVAPPGGESLKDTRARVMPYFDAEIAPRLRAGTNILVVAHGNSLRSLIMHVEELSAEEILKVEIPTGVPITYELDQDLHVVQKTVHTPAA
ncbi:MAG: 2,3-bisphosphoglycerate-dependent phosphoglycerate mutase [Candidatus Kapabacteria bacterium]|nr:2,3-bisphosphoglycerate-dependent phosphoglycerate mutase [Candidatus Kapabacteria bacterium]